MGTFIDLIFRALEALIFAHVIISWIPGIQYHPVSRWIRETVDPVLKPFQRLLPPGKTGGLDFSPLIAFLLLDIIRNIVANIL